MIAIIDYGMGNLRSVQKALERSGKEVRVTHDASDLEAADRLVLPGVGAMKPAMDRLKELNLIDIIKSQASLNKPFLGICLGYQLMFDKSDEGGSVDGMGLIQGKVTQFTSLKVPQIGWNSIEKKNDCPLFKGINEGSFVYFCHSYYVQPANTDVVSTQTNYGLDYASSIWKDNLMGVQFHPEKSQRVGLQILKNFTEIQL